MKLIYLGAPYPAYTRQFYGMRPYLELESFDTQAAALADDAFAWDGAWGPALAPQGIEVQEVLCNVTPLQRTWAWEHDRALLSDRDLRRVAIEQVRLGRPDVLLFDHYDNEMLREIKRQTPSLKLIIGWAGGTPPEDVAWGEYDLVLSCAPETVEWLRLRGVHADVLQHGFNDRVLPAIQSIPKSNDLAFFGQIVTSSAFHGERERFLERLIDQGLPLEIYSPSYELSSWDDFVAIVKMGAWAGTRTLKFLRVPDSAIGKLPIIRRGLGYASRPTMPVSAKLKPHMRAGKFGLAMFKAIAATRVSLNVHADASIRFASNMRLFETAGAGGCLLTDWKENIPELFEPDKEIVTYRSFDECVEKINWLLRHLAACQAIGKAAQERALREHTYKHRGERLAQLIRGALQNLSGADRAVQSVP